MTSEREGEKGGGGGWMPSSNDNELLFFYRHKNPALQYKTLVKITVGF